MRNEIKVSNEQLMTTPIVELVPNTGDYIRILIGGQHEGVLVRVDGNDHHIFLWTNCSWANGAGQGDASSHGYGYSWNLNHVITSDEPTLTGLCNYGGDPFRGKTFVCASGVVRAKRPDKNKFFHSGYTMDRIYTGHHGYHMSHASGYYNTPKKDTQSYKIGVELEVECNDRNKYNEVVGVKSNWFTMESDGSLGRYGVEFITIPMLPKDIKSVKLWSPMTEYLCSRAQSWSKSTCGLHVHIGREILGATAEECSETIGKMLYLYHHYLKHHALNRKIFGRTCAYNDHDGTTESANAVKVLGGDVLKVKAVKDKVKKELTDKSMSTRYFDINLQNTNTIEFRRGRGSINANRITAVITYCELICLYSRKTKWDAINADHFYAWCRARLKEDSSLHHYLPSDESCD